jgi:hypothetical protein
VGVVEAPLWVGLRGCGGSLGSSFCLS